MNTLRFDHILRQVLLIPIFAVLLGAAALYWQMHDANRTVERVETSDANIARTMLVQQLFIDRETGLRGLQATRDPEFLEPYFNAGNTLYDVLDRLRTDAGSDPQRAALVDDLSRAGQVWDQDFAVPLIATVKAGGRTDDKDLNLIGKREMDDIRARIAALIALEQSRRDEQETVWHRETRHMSLALAALAILIGGVIGLYTRNLVQDLSRAFRRSNHTLRARAEEAFRSEQRLRTTLASIGDGVITCNAEGHVESMNTVAQTLTGWADADALGRPLAEVFCILREADRQPMEDPVSKVKRLNRVVGLANHTILVRKDGAELQIDDSGAPVRDKDGTLMGIVLVFRDVTMERKSQAVLLANEKLAVAGRLAATIAHEIHNPLDSVSNLLFLMDGKSSPEESEHFLQLAKSEINRVTQISRAMLGLYREARNPIPVDLQLMLESILLLMESRFLALGVHVERTLVPDLVILGFPAELRQVFTNLLMNAAEASGQGGVIRVYTEYEADHLSADGTRKEAGVCVVIEDEGPGIPPETRERLFEPFFTTKGEQGTGLGLWVSRGIISKHGGSITLESSMDPGDHGTTVSVFLASEPLLQAVPDVAAATAGDEV